MSYFGAKLRSLRTARGLSQTDLAQQLGLSKSSVSMYERGAREPNFETLASLAAYFGCDPNRLLGIPNTAHPDRAASAAAQDAFAPLSADEQALLAAYRTLGEEGRDYVRRSAELARFLRRPDAETR